jgi:flagella basal body P-ring formation protein FlgA
LPFLVAVHWGDAAQPTVATVALRPAAIVASKLATNPFVVHTGSPAVLLLDSDHVHIRLTVVCLENGSPGQTIRVETQDHSQTFEAQVQDAAY